MLFNFTLLYIEDTALIALRPHSNPLSATRWVHTVDCMICSGLAGKTQNEHVSCTYAHILTERGCGHNSTPCCLQNSIYESFIPIR